MDIYPRIKLYKMFRYLSALLIGVLTMAGAPVYAAEACSAERVQEVLTSATNSSKDVRISCDLTLNSSNVVTKRLILEGPSASNVTVECNGAHLNGGSGTPNYKRDMIEIRSHKTMGSRGDSRWNRPENITVRNCNITGSMRIYGMAKNGEGRDLRDSSRRAGHVMRARNAAPRRIMLDNLTITGVGRTPLYIAPGTMYVTLQNSELKGKATSVGLYLDTESYGNVIRNNYLHVTSRKEYVGGVYVRKREEMTIDNSSYNKIINNRFSTLEGGGIYVYRNCGEGGTIRHGIPRNNHIINNVFYYDKYTGDNPAVYLGSRTGNWWRVYCAHDEGYRWGSSASDDSYARYNIVMQNQIYKRSVSDMIKQGNSTNRPNYIAYNQTVSSARTRLAGCYFPTAFGTDFLLHGESTDVFPSTGGEPTCRNYRAVCTDGTISISSQSPSSCSIQRRHFDCRARGDHNGCRRIAYCPSGTRAIGAVAADYLTGRSISAATPKP